MISQHLLLKQIKSKGNEEPFDIAGICFFFQGGAKFSTCSGQNLYGGGGGEAGSGALPPVEESQYEVFQNKGINKNVNSELFITFSTSF